MKTGNHPPTVLTVKKPTRLEYNRHNQFQLNEEELTRILTMNPKDMTPFEKNVWKMEIFNEAEDMGVLLDKKIRLIQDEREKIKDTFDAN